MEDVVAVSQGWQSKRAEMLILPASCQLHGTEATQEVPPTDDGPRLPYLRVFCWFVQSNLVSGGTEHGSAPLVPHIRRTCRRITQRATTIQRLLPSPSARRTASERAVSFCKPFGGDIACENVGDLSFACVPSTAIGPACVRASRSGPD